MSVMKQIYKRVGLLDFLFAYFQLLPNFVLNKIAHEIAKKGKREMKKPGLPHHLTFFVTNKCNLKCAHCFYISELNNNKEEMSLDQIKRLAISMDGKIHQVVLTGGEPFLRKEFVDICSVLEEYAGVQSATIMTNGSMPERIEHDISEIINRTSMSLSFQISIDGPLSVHDVNRGKKGAFNNAIQTIRRLQGLQNGGRIQRITTATAISQTNLKYIEDILCELRKLKGVLHGFTFVRGSSRNTIGLSDKSLLSGFDPDESMYLSTKQIKETIKILDDKLWRRIKPNLYYATNRMLLNLIANYTEEGLKDNHCMAGTADFTIYANGDVSLCEMLKPFGNIKKYNFNVQKFWECEYGIYRKKVAGCKCTHDCNILSTIKFDKEKLSALFRNSV